MFRLIASPTIFFPFHYLSLDELAQNTIKIINEVIEKFGVELLGTSIETIRDAEDRERFKALMHAIGEPVPESRTVTSLPEAWDFAQVCGFPLIIRPAYTLGGSGGGVARHEDEFEAVVTQGLQTSPIHQVLVERSLIGWKESGSKTVLLGNIYMCRDKTYHLHPHPQSY